MARLPRPPRLEAITPAKARIYASRPHLSEAEVRAQIIAEQALSQLAGQIAASRAAAPGASISAYRTLAAAFGADIAALLPGTQTRTGGNPPFAARGVLRDLFLVQPYLRGYRAWGRAGRSIKAREPVRETIKAARTKHAIAGPAARAVGQPLAGPELRPQDGSERVDYNVASLVKRSKQMKQELQRKRAFATALANRQALMPPAMRRRGGR